MLSGTPASTAHSGCHLQGPHQSLAKGRNVFGSQLDGWGSGPLPVSPASLSTLSSAVWQSACARQREMRMPFDLLAIPLLGDTVHM